MIIMNKQNQIIKMIYDGISINKISNELNVAKSTIYHHYRKIKGRKVPQAAIHQEDKVIGEFLGAFAGDGSYFFDPKTYHHTLSFHLHNKDDYLYGLYLQEMIRDRFKVSCRKYSYNNSLSLVLYSKSLCELITKNLIISRDKTLNIALRENISGYSYEFLKWFVRGVFDTDGSVSRYRIILKMISKNLVDQISVILLGFGIENSTRLIKDKRENCRDCHELTIKKRQMIRFLNCIGLSNPRKLNRLKEACGSRDSNFRT